MTNQGNPTLHFWMNYFFLFFFTLSFNECFSMLKSGNPREEAMTVIHNYSKSLKREGIINRWHGVRCAGQDKVYDGKIHEISLGYSTDQNLNYHEARHLFYRIVDDLLREINCNEEIKSQFFHYPVTYKDLHFVLAFNYDNKRNLKKDDVDIISMQENEIFYSIANIDGATDNLLFQEKCPNLGTVTHTGVDSMRKVIRKLPESEEEANTVP